MEDTKEKVPLNVQAINDVRIVKGEDKGPPSLRDSRETFSPMFRQCLAASGPIIATLSSGMTSGYSAILLPQLQAEESDIQITKSEASWIASMAALPMAVGCILSGYLMDKYGRRVTHIILCVPYVIGWLVLASASNIPALYIGRFTTGLCVGMLSPPCQVYIAETSHPKNRGALLSAVSLSVSLGILLSHIFGTFLHWKIVAGIGSLCPILCIVIIYCVPESPTWLIAQKKTIEGEDAYHWFRGYSNEANLELENLLNKQKFVFNQTDHQTSTNNDFKKLLIKSSFLKPFLIMNVFFVVQQFSGVNAVAFYTVTMLKEVITDVNEYLTTIIIDIVRVVFSGVAVVLLKQYGRRALTLASGVGTIISLFSLAVYLSVVGLEQNGGNFNETQTELPTVNNNFVIYLPLVILIFYICFVSIGLVPLPWVLSGEVFSRDTRGFGSGVTCSFGFICFFLVVKTSPDLISLLGNAGTFALYGIVTFFGVIFLYFFLPETKDKSLLEIESHFNKNKNKSIALSTL